MSSGPARYRLVVSGAVRGDLLRLADLAAAMGVTTFRNDLLEIAARLTADPNGWGDPLYTLHQLGVVVCHRLLRDLHVNYGIDETRRLVYLRWIRLWRL